MSASEEQAARLRELKMNLTTLADWLDLKYPDGQDEVQEDLRFLGEHLPGLLDAWEEREVSLQISDDYKQLVIKRDAAQERERELETEVARLKALIVGFKNEHFNDPNTDGEMECGCDYCIGFYDESLQRQVRDPASFGTTPA